MKRAPSHARRSAIAVAAMLLALSACDSKDDDLSRLDANIANATDDPALREAVESRLASDPQLASQANRDAVRPPPTPLTGAVPRRLPAKDARAEALRLAGGRLVATPAAVKSVTATDTPVTLGGLARQQSAEGRACRPGHVRYAPEWAGRMPADFPVYPGAALTEAAGADNAPCNIRAASFTTPVPLTEVMDFYATMAKRGGYTLEHIEQNGDDVIGGTRNRDEGAFYVALRPLKGGGTSVDLIANGGR